MGVESSGDSLVTRLYGRPRVAHFLLQIYDTIDEEHNPKLLGEKYYRKSK